MSGVLRSRVNRYWNRSIQTDFTTAIFFWEWINFLYDHTTVTWIGYGTGKSQTGVTPPDSWRLWDTENDAVPFNDNSWIVFEMTNASELLDGSSSFPWQAKIQFTSSTGFDDCNVADTDYDYETETYMVAMRASAMGGWVGASTCDFIPSGGEDASNNLNIYQGQELDLHLDIIGDDDVIFWKGSAENNVGDLLDQSRGGYLGMIQRRNSDITYPFIFMAGRISDYAPSITIGYNATNRKYTSGNWYNDYATLAWPNYSLWHDGTQVNTLRADTLSSYTLMLITPDPVTGEDILPYIMVAQWESPNKYAIIGEFLMIVSTNAEREQHVVLGSNTMKWIEICYDTTMRGGVAMRWPLATTPIW